MTNTPTRCPKCDSANIIKNAGLNLMTGTNQFVCDRCGNLDFSPGDRTVASVLLDAQPLFKVAPPLPTLEQLVPRYVEALIRSGDIDHRDANHAVVLAVDLAKETRKQLKMEADDE